MTFTQSYPVCVTKNDGQGKIRIIKLQSMANVIRGKGINKYSKVEGIRIMNMFSTYILGPILVTNPLFTKYLLNIIGYNKKLYLYDQMLDAYNIRLKDYMDKDKKID